MASQKIGFLIESHVGQAVVGALIADGADAVTTAEVGLRESPDAEVLAYAYSTGRVVVTADDDFLRLAASGAAHVGIVALAEARLVARNIASLRLIFAVLTRDDIHGRVEHW